MLQQIRIDDLLARDVEIRWIEGVALVQAVIRQVVASAAAQAAFPSLAAIVLEAAGTVEIAGPATSSQPVAAAAHLLARMLNDDVPVRLRLIVTQATGGVEAYPTLQEFSSAIEYFERPDGASILSALFQRALLAPIRSQETALQEASPVAEHRSNSEQRPPRRRRSVLWLLAPFGALVYAGVLWAFAPGLSTARAVTGFTRSTASASPALAPATVTSKRGPARRHDSPREKGRSPSPPLIAAVQQPVQPLIVPQLHPAVEGEVSWIPDGVAFAGVTQSTQARSAADPLVFFSSVEITASPTTGTSETSSTYTQSGNSTNSGRIYSRADPGVIPPRSVYPKLPDPPPPGTRIADEAILDLLIAPTGIVERVQLKTIPKHIHEFMLVSAAKAWQFQPATLDGHPVRFLHRVLLPLQ